MALRISRVSWVLGRPRLLGEGTWICKHSHSASDRSVEEHFSILQSVCHRPTRSLFQTVSEGEFLEVRASATRSRNVRGWYFGTPRRAQHAAPGSAARSPQPLGPPLV